MNNLDNACKSLQKLLQNPYAIERREKNQKAEKETAKQKWENYKKYKKVY